VVPRPKGGGQGIEGQGGGCGGGGISGGIEGSTGEGTAGIVKGTAGVGEDVLRGGLQPCLGFVDLQVNGYLGTSFSSDTLTLESCVSTCEALLAGGGCACIVPTVITAPVATLEHVLPILADACECERLRGRLLGIHLEGPFISALKGAVGTHPAQCVLSPAASEGCAMLDRWQALARGHIKLLTIAAEVDGAAALCAHAVSKGIAVSLGHMLATAEDIGRLAAAGATLLTHLGNGCPNEIHRHRNHLWPALADDRLSAMLITDGQHLPADALAAMIRCKSVGGAIVTSDVAPVAGLPDGTHACFGGTVHVEGRYVRSADRSCLAGSGALMIDCMNHLASLQLRPTAGRPEPLTLAELLRLGFENPLRALGLDPVAVARQLAALGPLVLYDERRREFRRRDHGVSHRGGRNEGERGGL
jgi:N-acetylglucosamine-6-phosphate deacetylase